MKKMIILASLMLSTLMTLPANSEAQEIFQIADGSWGDGLNTYGNGFAYEFKNIWVDIAVQNLGYHKDVGIVWSDNDGYTWNVAAAWYEGYLGDGYEIWGLDVIPVGIADYKRFGTYWEENTGYSHPIGPQKTIEYAIFYTVNGITYWDNNNGQNYHIVVMSR